MAAVYFTNNAATGSGSLAEAVKNAAPGDVVRPDPAVFERGATIEIALASQLNVEKNLTLDASPFRVRLDGGGSRLCAFVAKQVVATFTAVDFVAGSYQFSGGGVRVETSAAAIFNRCRFAGCRANYGGAIFSETGSSLTLNDCVVAGCAGTSGIGGIYAKGGVALNGVTVAGCVAPTGFDVSTSSSATAVFRNSFLGRSNVNVGADSGCVVNVADSAIGYVAPPPDDLTLDDWNANLWRGWDLRLLDDGAANPSPYRNAGNPAFASEFDFDGNRRGRRVDGATSCSPGAYETIQADLFWIGGAVSQAELDAAPQDLKLVDVEVGASVSGTIAWTLPEPGAEIRALSRSGGSTWRVLSASPGDATSRRFSGVGLGRRVEYSFQVVFASGVKSAWSTIAFVGEANGGAPVWRVETERSPALADAAGWASSRFASTSGTTAPTSANSAFVGVNADFVDASDAPELALAVGGFRRVGLCGGKLRAFSLGLAAELAASARVFVDVETFRLAPNSNVDASLIVRSDAGSGGAPGATIASAAFYALAPTDARYGTLKAARTSGGATVLDGEYACETFSTLKGGDGSTYAIGTAPGSTIRCQHFLCAADFASGRLFTNPVVVELYGAATATATRTGTTAEDFGGAFVVDLSDATEATLTLDGQTFFGDVPDLAATLSGTAKLDGRGLTTRSLTLAAGATLSVENAEVSFGALTLESAPAAESAGIARPVAATLTAAGATLAATSADLTNATLTLVDSSFELDALTAVASSVELDASTLTATSADLTGATLTLADSEFKADELTTALATTTATDSTLTATNVDLTLSELTLERSTLFVADELMGDGATIAATSATATATIADLTGATLTLADSKFTADALTLGDGASVEFSGVDSILTGVDGATVGAVALVGTGYFVAPFGTDSSAATIAETVRVVDLGVAIESFAATATSATTARIEWTASDETARVCVERESAEAPGGWELLHAGPSADGTPLEVALSGTERFRIFDGAEFRVDSASARVFAPFWQVAAWGEVAAESANDDSAPRFVVRAWAVPVDRAV